MRLAGPGLELVAAQPRVPADRGCEVEKPERRCDHSSRRRAVSVVLRDERGHLRQPRQDAEHEQHEPATLDGHVGRRREDDRHEADAQRGEAALEDDHRRHQHGADQAEPRKRLRVPAQRQRGTDRSDARGAGQRRDRRQQVIESNT